MKNNLQFNQKQKDIILGSLLGDGKLISNDKGRTWQFYVSHWNKYSSYFYHKFFSLYNFCKDRPRYNSVYHLGTPLYNYSKYYFNTSVHNNFRFYGNLFYTYDPINDRLVKKLPLNLGKFLSPRAIAYWYMDKGCIKLIGQSKLMVIRTEKFTFKEINYLKKILISKYSIKTNLIRKMNKGVFIGFRLVINKKSSLAFCKLIEPYLIYHVPFEWPLLY